VLWGNTPGSVLSLFCRPAPALRATHKERSPRRTSRTETSRRGVVQRRAPLIRVHGLVRLQGPHRARPGRRNLCPVIPVRRQHCQPSRARAGMLRAARMLRTASPGRASRPSQDKRPGRERTRERHLARARTPPGGHGPVAAPAAAAAAAVAQLPRLPVVPSRGAVRREAGDAKPSPSRFTQATAQACLECLPRVDLVSEGPCPKRRCRPRSYTIPKTRWSSSTWTGRSSTRSR
jgi:hypothetical protein